MIKINAKDSKKSNAKINIWNTKLTTKKVRRNLLNTVERTIVEARYLDRNKVIRKTCIRHLNKNKVSTIIEKKKPNVKTKYKKMVVLDLMKVIVKKKKKKVITKPKKVVVIKKSKKVVKKKK